MSYLTDPIYRASRPDAVQALYAIPVSDQAARQAEALALTARGYKINMPIDVWGWDAAKVMGYAQDLGLKFLPAMNETLPGTIPVSIDAADYPPADPAPAPPPLPTSPVGPMVTPGLYGVTQAAFYNSQPIFKEGNTITAPDGNQVIYHEYINVMGFVGRDWETADYRAKRIAQGG